MVTEAIKAGYYHSEGWGKDYPRIQIRTIDEMLNEIKVGKAAKVDMPPQFGTFKQAQRVQQADAAQPELGLCAE